MRPIWKTMSVLGLLGLGYVLGAAGTLSPRPLGAQAAAQAGGPSEESRKKLSEAFSALKAAAETLEQENLYVSATSHLNVFAITAGGINAINDLEEARGVDPETFAALYAGEGKPDVKEHLDYDDQGRLTYKGKVIRIYSKQRMKKIFQERLKYTTGGGSKK